MRGVAGNSKNAVRLPLFLSAAIHLGVLLLALLGPRLLPEKIPLPEVYQVELYTPSEVQSEAQPVATQPQAMAPTPSAAVAPKAEPKPAISTPVAPPPKVAAVSLSPLKERLARENREREEAHRNRQLAEQVSQLKMDLQRQRAEGQAREATHLAREAIAETYRTTQAGSAPAATPLGPEGRPRPPGEKIAASEPSQGPGTYAPTPGQLEAQATYIARLKDLLRRHWKLPVLQDWDAKLSATVVIKIRQDGSVITTWFERHSNNPRFDQYVKRAVDQSVPLPPLPREFGQKTEEIAVTFTPGGLK
jgi:outer membrane biosynthesis protein TonB